MSTKLNNFGDTALGVAKRAMPLLAGAAIIAGLGHVDSAWAQDAAAAPAPVVDKGDTAWMLTSTVLVLAMTVPGLALFYGGLVRAKNMLSMLVHVAVVASIGMIAWAFWGYSLAFTDGGSSSAFVGDFSKAFLKGVTASSNAATFSAGYEIPELVFVAFQMTFAAITPGLILGATAERMKIAAVVVFSVLWPLLSYYPIAHMVWEAKGLMFGWGTLDFAGGTVVHINAGFGALVACLILGPRTGYRNEPMAPHSLTLTYVGAGLLWVGWFGFNAGSNLEANGTTALVMVNTFLATAAAGLSWAAVEWVLNKRPSMLGLASGMVAGLVAITPACGVSGPIGAIVLGLLVSPICIFFVAKVKHIFKYDDSLDAFGVHGIGGTVGAIATGILAAPALGGTPPANYEMVAQVLIQTKAVLVSIVWTSVATAITFYIIKFTVGLRASTDAEEEGLDIAEHGERAYHI